MPTTKIAGALKPIFERVKRAGVRNLQVRGVVVITWRRGLRGRRFDLALAIYLAPAPEHGGGDPTRSGAGRLTASTTVRASSAPC